jgi:phage terminase small subunit
MARGGYRPNSGPEKGTKYKKKGDVDNKKTKPKKDSIPDDIKADAAKENLDPLAYMLKVMNDTKIDPTRRDRMAISAAPFCHARKGEGQGKKSEKDDKAKAAGVGKFSAGTPPLKLVKNN